MLNYGLLAMNRNISHTYKLSSPPSVAKTHTHYKTGHTTKNVNISFQSICFSVKVVTRLSLDFYGVVFLYRFTN